MSNADVTQATSVQGLSLISTIGLKIERQWLGTVLDCFFDGHTRPAGEIAQILEKRGQKRKPSTRSRPAPGDRYDHLWD
jgi:hypothetical protein